MGAESWVLSTVKKGLRIQFHSSPLTTDPSPIQLPKNKVRRKVLLSEIEAMLQKKALEVVPRPLTPGHYSHMFTVTKKSGGWRLVTDLKILNQKIVCPHFKMETAHSIRAQLRTGEWVVSADLSDAYLHILVHPKFRKFMRINIQGKIMQFRSMCFGLNTAPLIFTRVTRAMASYFRSRAIKVHMYLDDWLIRADSPEQLAKTPN